MKAMKVFLPVLLILNLNLNSQENIKIKKKDFDLKKPGLNQAMKNIKYGDFYFEQNTEVAYHIALNYYLKAYEYNQENAVLNYKIGVCYIKSVNGSKSLPYLKKAFEQDSALSSDIEFFYAYSLQLNYFFDDAIKHFENYKKTKQLNSWELKIVNKHIEECKNGKILLKNKRQIVVKNLEIVNSPYKDYACLLTADGSKMYFSSRRPNIANKLPNGEYSEDIYLTVKDSLFWQKPVNVKSLNTPLNDDVVGISHDGNTLIIYKDGDLYFSELQGDIWSKPKAFPKTINSEQTESSACFSLNDSILYFVRGKSDNPLESNGDIYYSKLDKNGNWTEPVRLPDNINSPYDEDAVYMFADGKTLFFSSKGHNSIGGYDIFKTELQPDGSFSDPVNLGYPINSPDNDIYFFLEPGKFRAYLTSIRNDSKGYTDIYTVEFYENLYLSSEDNLISFFEDSPEIVIDQAKVLVVIKGIVSDEKGNPLEAKIKVIDNQRNKEIFSTKSNSKSGAYSLVIPSGFNYSLRVEKQGFLFCSENINLLGNSKFLTIKKNFILKSIEKDKSIILHNIFFDFASAKLRPSSYNELNFLADFLKQNKSLKIEISGHTDNIGSYEKNMELSRLRAEAVANYLINKGISRERIIVKGYGYTKPLVPNTTAENRQKNRRVEFKIIEN